MSAFSRVFFSFIEVARERSIRRAAEKLNVSASALSRQMQMLERDFGVRLLVRLPQGVQLTEQGRVLLAQAEKWLDDESGLRASMRPGLQGDTLPLRLGLMECLVPFVRQALAGADSDITSLKVTVGDTGSLIELLRTNQLDAIVAFNVPRLPELRVHYERDYELGLVHAPDFPPPGNPPFRLEDCLECPLCLPDTSLSVWPRLDSEVYRTRSDPRIVLRSNSITMILDFVSAGKGVSFLTWLDAAAGVARGDLCFAPLASRRLAERLYLCTAIGAPLDTRRLEMLIKLYRVIPAGSGS